MKKSANDFQRKKGDNVISTELPMGFSNALAKNTSALAYFTNLTDDMKQSVIDQTHTIQSKGQMQQFVDSLVPRIQSF